MFRDLFTPLSSFFTSTSVLFRHPFAFLPVMGDATGPKNANTGPNSGDDRLPGRDEEKHLQSEECVEAEEQEDCGESEESESESESESSEEEQEQSRAAETRTPFTNLSQIDADLALARTLQEQERAYMMYSMGNADDGESEHGSEYDLDYENGDGEEIQVGDHGSLEGIEYDDDEDELDAFDVQEHVDGIDPSAYNDDEAYARALQEAEEHELASRLMALAGINDWIEEGGEDHGSNSQDTWQDVDPDDFSYEELIALGEAVGTESRGLSTDTIASLPSVSYKTPDSQDENAEPCVICRLDYEDGDSLNILPCKHTYHSDCINKWLQINKVCPVCSREVSTSEPKA